MSWWSKKRKICVDCRFCVDVVAEGDTTGTVIGHVCRRFPPSRVPMPQKQTFVSDFPRVLRNWWCGEWRHK